VRVLVRRHEEASLTTGQPTRRGAQAPDCTHSGPLINGIGTSLARARSRRALGQGWTNREAVGRGLSRAAICEPFLSVERVDPRTGVEEYAGFLVADPRSVGMGLFFYPRGGSARVAGYLARALPAVGWHVTLACGSLGEAGALGNAGSVFAGVDMVVARYDDAVARWARGGDPMDAPFPMHPSFEVRPGVPDRAFPWVSPVQGERMAVTWAALFAQSEAMAEARLLHLHHLTPIHDAAALALPGVPVVTLLHGTELKMLAAIARGEPTIDGPFAEWWVSRMRASARRSAATITISPHDQSAAVRLLGIDPDTVHSIPNGVGIARFIPHRPSSEERRTHWLRWLVGDPRGWDEATSTPGSIRYTEAEVIDGFFDAETGEALPVLMYVGRVPGLQTRAAARSRLRAGTEADAGACAAGDLGRLAGRVGGRASPYGRDARAHRGGVLRRMARPRRAPAWAELR